MSTFNQELLEKYMDILQISYWLSLDEIRKIYRKKAMEYHPDRNHWFKMEAEEKMAQLNQAYDYIQKYYNSYITVNYKQEKSFDTMNKYEKLEYLANLYKAWILSNEEFEVEKSKILWKNFETNEKIKKSSNWDDKITMTWWDWFLIIILLGAVIQWIERLWNFF